MATTKPIFIEADSLAGTHKSYAEKTLAPDEVYKGKNYRQNDEGGRYPRPGFEDSEVDLTSLALIAGRGVHSSRTPKKLWLAADTGSSVKLIFVETTDPTDAHYKLPFDTGLSLQTGKYVHMLDFEGDLYYANGYDTVGRIIIGTVASGGVLAGATELNLKTGQGVRFPASGTGYITNTDGTIDTFTFGGKTSDQLTTVAGILAHGEGAVVFMLSTLSPSYDDKAAVLAEWLASLNLGGDPDNPRVWEFSQFASASNLAKFYTFGSSPSGTELLGEGGEITAMFPTKNFFFVLKNTGIYGTARADIDISTGARIPQPIRKGVGCPNQRCITTIDEDVAVYLGTDRRLYVLRGSIINGQTDIKVQENFDNDIEKDLLGADLPGTAEWVHYETSEKLLKVCVLKQAVRYIYVRDFSIGKSGVWYDADQGKNYDCVCSHEEKTWAYDGAANKLYIDETGTIDDDVPIETSWKTGRMGRGEWLRAKAKMILTHGFMTRNSVAYLDFYKNGEFQFTKTLDDSRINSLDDGQQIGDGAVGRMGFGTSGPSGTAYPFKWPFGANKKGDDFAIEVRINGDNGDFVQFDGYKIVCRPLRRISQVRS
ncbi:hypothetical protein KW797_00265 [Candidatus Parcubacteria bacterium]|nr:hypothetical protein [Candidatus Parcubacteria bacterium]